jgi:outer membrane immunogenic protein
MRKSLIAGAAVAALFHYWASVSPARAADLAVPPADGCLWCGFYLGANAGWAFGTTAVTTTSFFPAPFLAIDVAAVNAGASPTLSSNGVTGGAQAGYNWQIGRAVFGLETDFDVPSLKASQSGTFPFASAPALFFNTATTVSTDWLVTLRPRAGWTINNWLVYATGGLAVGRETLSQTVNLLAGNVLSSNFSVTQIGWTAGAGVEAKLTPNLSAKAEYLYVGLGTTPAIAGVLTPAAAASGVSNATRFGTSIARVGLNWQFDHLSLFWPSR